MSDKNYFREPRDVTLEYRKRAKSLPYGLLWSVLAWITMIAVAWFFEWLWLIVCAVVLLAIIVLSVPQMFRERRMIVRALREGPIVRRLRMDELVLEATIESSADPSIVLKRDSFRLVDVEDVGVTYGTISVSSYDQDEWPGVELKREDFVDQAARYACLLELLALVDRNGPKRDDKDAPEIWIGKL